MKNILIIVPGLGLGGQEKIAVNTAKILSKNYNIYFCVFNLSNAVYKTEFNVINLKLPSKPNLLGQIKNVIMRTLALKKLNKQYKIDITISFGTTANIASIFSKVSNKVIVSVRGYESITSNFLNQYKDKLVYKKADQIICVAEKLATDLSKNYSIPPSKIKTLYNSYDFKGIKEKANEPNPLEISFPTIVTMGRLENVKGYRHLFKSVKIAIESIPNLNLILIGKGEERNSLEHYAAELGIQENVTFIGFQSNPYSYLSKCNLYVLSSIYEGFPNALVEAMACGLPVIATDCKTGPREILNENFKDEVVNDIAYSDYGVLVPTFVADDSIETKKELLLAKAIVEILTKKDLYNLYCERSLKRAKMFSNEVYKSKLINILEEE